MKKLRYVLASVLMLGLAIPGVALADDDDDSDRGKRCSNIGTFFGIVSPENKYLTGWMTSVTGKSENHGTNILEFPNYDPTLGGSFDKAVRLSTMRGNWYRTGKRTFVYTMMGYAVDVDNQPVYISKVYGDATHTKDCQFEYITTTLEIFLPFMSPFNDGAFHTEVLEPHWGHRAYVDLP